jgi:hypothetical protein
LGLQQDTPSLVEPSRELLLSKHTPKSNEDFASTAMQSQAEPKQGCATKEASNASLDQRIMPNADSTKESQERRDQQRPI